MLWDRLGLGAFALGTLIGPFVSFLLLLVAMIRRKVAPRPHLLSRGLGLGALARHAFPLTISSAILQINVIFDRAVASLSRRVRSARCATVTPSFASRPAPSAPLGVPPSIRRSFDRPIRTNSGLASWRIGRCATSWSIFVPVSALTLAVAPVAASTAYGRGAFTPEDLFVTALVVAGFAPLVCALMVSHTLTGALNARSSGNMLLAAGIINVS